MGLLHERFELYYGNDFITKAVRLIQATNSYHRLRCDEGNCF